MAGVRSVNGIFISYRRVDSRIYAGRLFDRLRRHFGADRVFMDVEGGIPRGQDFSNAIGAALNSASAVVVVIGRQWLTCKDVHGKRRLELEDDWVRNEIIVTLSRGVPLLPVLVDGALLPSPDQLPVQLQPLTRRQASEISDNRWDYDVGEIIKALEHAISDPFRKSIKWAAIGCIAIAIVLGAVIARKRISEQTSSSTKLPPSVSRGTRSEDRNLASARSQSGTAQTPSVVWNNETREWETNPKSKAAAFSALQTGLELLNNGKPDEAIPFFDRAIQLDGKYADAYYNRSLAYFNMGKFDLSLQDSNSVIDLTPRDEQALNNRGWTYTTLKQFDKALADFDGAIRLNPSYFRAYQNRGRVYRELKQYNKALQDYNKAVALNPSKSDLLKERAQIKKLLGDSRGAEADEQKASSMHN